MSAKSVEKTVHPELVGSWARQWHRQLQRFLAKRLPSQADPQDLVQEVYLRLLRFDGTELVRNPHAYLCKIATHVACEWQREARQTKPHSSDALDELIADDSLDDAIDLERRRDRLRDALERLPENMRAALTLVYQEGLSYEEVARKMSVSSRSARRYIEEGYVQLRKQLYVKGVDR